ncbi:hypothetical protein ACFQX6_41535 [Streptosporangium lutulentum]
MWARHDVFGITRESRRIHHRQVGDLTLTTEVFNVAGTLTSNWSSCTPSPRVLPSAPWPCWPTSPS